MVIFFRQNFVVERSSIVISLALHESHLTKVSFKPSSFGWHGTFLWPTWTQAKSASATFLHRFLLKWLDFVHKISPNNGMQGHLNSIITVSTLYFDVNILYKFWPPCHSKPVWISFLCGIQKEIFSRMLRLLFINAKLWLATGWCHDMKKRMAFVLPSHVIRNYLISTSEVIIMSLSHSSASLS